MGYLVTYSYCGDEETKVFYDKQSAMDFIADNVNKEAYASFALYERVPITFTVT